MKFNNLIVSVSILFLLLFLSVGIAAANENNTIVSPENDIGDDLSDSDESVNSNDSAEVYNAKIIAKNTTQKYNGDNEVAVKIVNKENGIVNSAKVCINGHITPTYDDEGIYYFYFDLKPGNHKLKVTLDDKYHKAKPVLINLKIVKSKFTGKINCKSYWGTDKSKLTMKATVYNDELFYHENGYVTFKVNGKSYKVKTKNGVAIKTIRIKKAGTFTYTAKFASDKYSSSVTGKGKLYVYSTSKKARTFKIKGYKIIVPIKKFNKLVNAKNNNKIVYFKIKTNKFVNQEVGNGKKVAKWKFMGKVLPETAHKYGWKTTNFVKHWIDEGVYYYTCNAYKKVYETKMNYRTVKAKVLMHISYGGKTGGQSSVANRYLIFLTTLYQNPGYDACSPWIYGSKICKDISKLNKAKTR